MPLSKFDRDNIGALLSNPNKYDWFTARLLRLIRHADRQNRAKLAIVYPEEVRVVCEYLGQAVPSVVDFPQIETRESR